MYPLCTLKSLASEKLGSVFHAAKSMGPAQNGAHWSTLESELYFLLPVSSLSWS
jgi:hypothetical protein